MTISRPMLPACLPRPSRTHTSLHSWLLSRSHFLAPRPFGKTFCTVASSSFPLWPPLGVWPPPLQHTTTIYLHNQVAEYAKELTDRMPGNLKVAYFVNSGRCAAGRGVRCRLLVVVLIFRVWWRALGTVCSGCFLYISSCLSWLFICNKTLCI